MIDIERIRQEPDLYRRAIAVKRVPLDLDRLLEVDKARRALEDQVNKMRHERNKLTDRIAKNRTKELIDEATIIGAQLVGAEAELKKQTTMFDELMALVPGVPCADVPEGTTDADNIETRRRGEPQHKPFPIKDHIELAKLHDMVDFEGARLIAGSRAYAMRGAGALLELALLRFAFDRIVAKGFTPYMPPLLVNYDAMFATGYFPLGEDEAYQLEKDKLFLTGTSEVGMAALQMKRTFEAKDLPLRMVGMTPCFRREAGAHGRDTRGLYRVHQFQKVEQVVFCANSEEESLREHLALLQNAEELVQALELPYRVVAVCTGDMGLGQVRKHDIETWMPSRNAYGETHSCSSFHEFQARRLRVRYKDGNGEKRFVHTLNNTAIATPRILIAFIENHQLENGAIHIPTALRPYLGGKDVLEPQ